MIHRRVVREVTNGQASIISRTRRERLTSVRIPEVKKGARLEDIWCANQPGTYWVIGVARIAFPRRLQNGVDELDRGASMFSVVMATYNGGRYIEKQVATIISQTTKPDELIVADDCSNDDTLEIVERMRPKMPFPLTVLRNPTRLGYGDNFLNACELASHSYICFSDQDDSWLPEKLSSYAEMIRAMPDVSLFIHQGEVVDEDLQPTGSNLPLITSDYFQPPLYGKPSPTAARICNVLLQEIDHE